MVNLRVLSVHHNSIVDLSPLRFLKQLKELGFANNRVIFLYPLEHLHLTIKQFCLEDNFIQSDQISFVTVKFRDDDEMSDNTRKIRSNHICYAQKTLDKQQKLYSQKIITILRTESLKNKSIKKQYNCFQAKINAFLTLNVEQLSRLALKTVQFIQNQSFW
ncbi:Leucine-rich_repeat domain superfamily [Hexamita inflata]|uniref:Leucine-rich repeat domain superfamily n=1 Tax=Hexamita inflata TaxID=28002 RepID=A0AA86R565_9EUKA|nr:Leucine-rich repeat domain superfamily [Hexamita inflata]